MSGAIHLLPLSGFMAWAGTILPLHFTATLNFFFLRTYNLNERCFCKTSNSDSLECVLASPSYNEPRSSSFSGFIREEESCLRDI
jgi:hypothetical protein